MLNSHVVQRTINRLRRPIIQRLITLVVSTLLAMSLGYATIMISLPKAGHAVAMSQISSEPSRLHAADPLVAELTQIFTLNMPVSRTLTLHLTGGQQAERRPA